MSVNLLLSIIHYYYLMAIITLENNHYYYYLKAIITLGNNRDFLMKTNKIIKTYFLHFLFYYI